MYGLTLEEQILHQNGVQYAIRGSQAFSATQNASGHMVGQPAPQHPLVSCVNVHPQRPRFNGHMAQRSIDNPVDLSHGKVTPLNGYIKEERLYGERHPGNAFHNTHNGVTSMTVGIPDQAHGNLS